MSACVAVLTGLIGLSFMRRGAMPLASAPARGDNVLLITIDTLRPDHLRAYGSRGRLDTPAISRLAREGVRFSAAYSAVPLTLPSHTTILTGLNPSTHGVRDNGGFYLDDHTPTLATVLRQQGFQTAAFVSAFVLDSRWGLSRGFDEYFDRFDVSTDDLAAMARVQRPGGETWAQALTWLRAHGSGRFFVWLHLFDPHTPYEPPEPFRTAFTAQPYDGEIAYDDSILSDVLDELTRQQLLDKTMIVLASDHGEGLGEHDEDEHGLLAYDSTLHVPWIVRLPHEQFAGTVVDQPVGLVDVLPTVLDLAGIAPPPNLDGVSRAGAMRTPARGGGGVLYAETFYPRLHFGWSELQSIRNDRYQMIRGKRTELYDYRADPGETTNLADRQPEITSRLGLILDHVVAERAHRPAAPTADPDAAGRLNALGYLSGSTTLRPTQSASADPRDKTGAYRRLTRGRQQLDQGHARDGIETFERLLTEEPDLDAAHRTLREYWIAHREYDQAFGWIRARLAARPGDPQLTVDQSSVDRAAGHIDRALAVLDDALSSHPDNVELLTLDGEILRDIRRYDAALTRFTSAERLSPQDITIRMQAANTLFAMRRLDEAAAAARDVLTRDSHAAGAHYLLAQIAEQWQDGPAAESEYRREIVESPWDYRARFNLAALVGGRGDHAEQLQLLESIPKLAPGFGDVNFFLAKALLDLGNPERFQEAIDDATRGLSLAPTSSAAPLGHYVLADIFRLQGRAVDSQRELLRGKALERQLAQRGAS